MHFSNRFVQELPNDTDSSNNCRQVYEAMYSHVDPTPVSKPQLLLLNEDLAKEIGWSAADCQTKKFKRVFAGNDVFDGMVTTASCYGGHQFGNWAGQLGDGRAIALGEVATANQFWELQLKGAGPTPYSRSGDGRAVLRSSIREYLCSEAMHHLGIPTTRALTLMATGDTVPRDMFYTGDVKDEPGAIVCRVAESFLRFGSFELFYARDDQANLKTLLDFTIKNYFSDCLQQTGNCYDLLFQKICIQTAELISKWMSVGFVHGVMNTDNMSILGLSIDYGPYGWLDIYKEDWTPNTTDSYGRRYCYANQPDVGGWNLFRLAHCFMPFVSDAQVLQDSLELYREEFNRKYTEIKLRKLGLNSTLNQPKVNVINDLYALMPKTETDMTVLFRVLSNVHKDALNTNQSDVERTSLISDAFYTYQDFTEGQHRDWSSWLSSYGAILNEEDQSENARHLDMKKVNPKYIARNYLVQLAIDDAEKGDYSTLEDLYTVLRSPFDEHVEKDSWAGKMPEWARTRPGCATLSCSS